MKDLSIAEEMFLISILKLKDNAYGVTIRQAVSQTTGRTYPYGTLYSTLDKLVRRSFLTKTVSEPLPERGGRSRNYYRITDLGIEALKKAMALKQMIWDDETQIALS
ncbi:PadR family transcriptional regulator [bacterium]|nr:PadR family transcriptional regulator [bacterium]